MSAKNEIERPDAEIDAEIRRRRHKTLADSALGPLISEFGAEAVCRALGNDHIADSLGLAQPECPGPDCTMCSGEVCNKCGAGSWRNVGPGDPICEHDTAERHEGT